jgi:ANTAR domain
MAKLESMPVIEQAKGIIMARAGLTEGDAFDLLRRASQQQNVPVRDLAAQIVASTAGNPRPRPGQDTPTDDYRVVLNKSRTPGLDGSCHQPGGP